MPSFNGFYPIMAGQDTPVEVGQGGIAGVLIGNESGYTLIVKMGGNYSRSLYPGWVDYFPVPQTQFSGVITLSNFAKLNNISTWPGSFAQVDVLGLGEQIHGTYPAPLVRNSNIGNTINTVGGTASAIQNDANPSGTSVVEATVQGDGASSIQFNNNGFLGLGISGTRDGQITVHDHRGSADDANIVGGQGTFPIGLIANLITALTNNDIGHHVGSGNRVVDTINGVDTFATDSSGAKLLAGTLQPNVAGTNLAGGLSGTATVWQPFGGSGLKLVLVELNAFRTGASNQTLALPVAFSTMALVWTGNIGSATGFNGFSLTSGGTPQNLNIITTWSVNGGTSTSATKMFGNSLAQVFNPFDSLQFLSGSTGNTFGTFIILGI